MPDKPVVWLSGEIKTPPFGASARLEAGFLLRQLQQGNLLGMPESRPMPSVGPGCHELRVSEPAHEWRIVYCVAREAIVILDVFEKKTRKTPKSVLESSKRRLRDYEKAR